MATRQRIKPLAQSSTKVATNAAAERARKLASKAALKQARETKPASKPELAPIEAATQGDKQYIEASNALAALRVDFAALNPEGMTFEQFVVDQGYNPDGTVNVKASKAHYGGPMLALRAAAKHYVTGANGNPHCNDALAVALAGLTREQVVTVLIAAMALPGNPYTRLNPGQQSMNLRNKARGMFVKGTLTIAAVTAALERASRHPE